MNPDSIATISLIVAFGSLLIAFGSFVVSAFAIYFTKVIQLNSIKYEKMTNMVELFKYVIGYYFTDDRFTFKGLNYSFKIMSRDLNLTIINEYKDVNYSLNQFTMSTIQCLTLDNTLLTEVRNAIIEHIKEDFNDDVRCNEISKIDDLAAKEEIKIIYNKKKNRAIKLYEINNRLDSEFPESLNLLYNVIPKIKLLVSKTIKKYTGQ